MQDVSHNGQWWRTWLGGLFSGLALAKKYAAKEKITDNDVYGLVIQNQLSHRSVTLSGVYITLHTFLTYVSWVSPAGIYCLVLRLYIAYYVCPYIPYGYSPAPSSPWVVLVQHTPLESTRGCRGKKRVSEERPICGG